MEDIKALELAVKALHKIRHDQYGVSASAARYGILFGIRAKKHFDEYTTAIERIKGMIERQGKQLEMKLEDHERTI